MTLDKKPTSVSEMKVWNYDGSSTGQAPGDDSEVLIRPVRIFPVPSGVVTTSWFCARL